MRGGDRLLASGGYELRGGPRAGSLTVLSPFGTTRALVEWDARGATLTTGATPAARYASPEALMRDAFGVALPLPALFDWLAGRGSGAEGWLPDLGGWRDGVVVARRGGPDPVEVRLTFRAD